MNQLKLKFANNGKMLFVCFISFRFNFVFLEILNLKIINIFISHVKYDDHIIIQSQSFGYQNELFKIEQIYLINVKII
jgi:hypothetical protein